MVKNISVTLPDENRYLLWDRTFKEQSPFVKKALSSLIQNYGSNVQSVIKDTDSGQLIYAHMGNFNRNVAKVPFDEVTRKSSLDLAAAGIVAIPHRRTCSSWLRQRHSSCAACPKLKARIAYRASSAEAFHLGGDSPCLQTIWKR